LDRLGEVFGRSIEEGGKKKGRKGGEEEKLPSGRDSVDIVKLGATVF